MPNTYRLVRMIVQRQIAVVIKDIVKQCTTVRMVEYISLQQSFPTLQSANGTRWHDNDTAGRPRIVRRRSASVESLLFRFSHALTGLSRVGFNRNTI